MLKRLAVLASLSIPQLFKDLPKNGRQPDTELQMWPPRAEAFLFLPVFSTYTGSNGDPPRGLSFEPSRKSSYSFNLFVDLIPGYNNILIGLGYLFKNNKIF